ncbi:hypothetical protein G5B40_01820 [Pikeienuella piscinae]|uniref:DUF1772 domain-containing protein n=1 Tax=Pikeienuella piscinae TaxID=2748098 RepID=A0A7L5BT10_9RHOB|nr:hypothetical protein [Pikeienuella piscinae]QIE54292.1 hypothetical protein G5B40_01820 [Pikeienuella piscinae]
MEMIFSGVAALSHDWRAWVVAALVALKAMHSVYYYLNCPIVRGDIAPGEDEVAVARTYRLAPPRGFLAIMLGGMALAIGGLYNLDNETYGPLALGALLIGIFMFTTEPNRLSVRNATMEVVATTGQSGEANSMARARLLSAHRTRALIEVGIAAVLLSLMFYL